ncbi:MAG TPA: hypothetical protein VF396_21125, partial [Bradyrhizobium sp.]
SVATTIAATMFAAATTARGLNNGRARHGSLPCWRQRDKNGLRFNLESPEGEQILHRREMTRCATHGHAFSSNRVGGKQRH